MKLPKILDPGFVGVLVAFGVLMGIDAFMGDYQAMMLDMMCTVVFVSIQEMQS